MNFLKFILFDSDFNFEFINLTHRSFTTFPSSLPKYFYSLLKTLSKSFLFRLVACLKIGFLMWLWKLIANNFIKFHLICFTLDQNYFIVEDSQKEIFPIFIFPLVNAKFVRDFFQPRFLNFYFRPAIVWLPNLLF